MGFHSIEAGEAEIIDTICSSRFECIVWSCCILGKSSCFLIWLREHALSDAIWVYFLVSACCNPCELSSIDGVVVPTPPEST
jgi:hypothetical protein